MEETPAVVVYHYYFEGISDNITILAENKMQARALLVEHIATLPQYKMENIVQETSSRPLTGVTSILINGQPHVWVGKTFSPTGWISKKQYENAINTTRQTRSADQKDNP